MTVSQAEYQFDLDISSRTQLNELQRLEQTHGQKVHEWVDEGMPQEAMGTPSAMQAFRKHKGTPVPWNVEAQNAQSVQRSTEATADTPPAGETGVPDSVREVISAWGHSLDVSVQRLMEDRMDESFDDVQVHTGSTAANACNDINARAFTIGNHIVFNQGEYNPSSAEGQHVIAHELAHVRQQTGGAVSMLPQDGLDLEIDPDPQLEHEAEETAQRVMAGSELGIQRLEDTAVHVQRTPHGNSRTAPGSYRDHSEVMAGRTHLLNGVRQGGMTVQGAHQQHGPSCFLAAFQAGLVAKGRNTESLARVLTLFPEKLLSKTDTGDRTVDLLMDKQYSAEDILQNRTADEGIRTALRTILQQSGTDSTRHTSHYTKGIVSVLASLFEYANTGMDEDGPVAPDKLQQIDEDIHTGTNLLTLLSERGLNFGSASNPRTLKNEASIEALKTKFMQIVDEIETPFVVVLKAKYDPFVNRVEEDEASRHAIVVSGIRREDDGTTFVELRDSNDPDGWTQEIPVDKFLSPLEDQTIKQQLGRDPGSGDGFVIHDLHMDVEQMDRISKPIETPDETATQQPRPPLPTERDAYDHRHQQLRAEHSAASHNLNKAWMEKDSEKRTFKRFQEANTVVDQVSQQGRAAESAVNQARHRVLALEAAFRQNLRQTRETHTSTNYPLEQSQTALPATGQILEQPQAVQPDGSHVLKQAQATQTALREAFGELQAAEAVFEQCTQKILDANSAVIHYRQQGETHARNFKTAVDRFQQHSERRNQHITALRHVGRPVIDAQVTQALQQTRRQATSVQPIDRTRRAYVRQLGAWQQQLALHRQQYTTFAQDATHILTGANHLLDSLEAAIEQATQALQQVQQTLQQAQELSQSIQLRRQQHGQLSQAIANKQAAVGQRRTALEQEYDQANQDLTGFYAPFAQAKADRTARWAEADTQSPMEKQARRQSETFAMASRTYEQIFKETPGNDLQQQYQQLQEAFEEFSRQAERFGAVDEQVQQSKRQRVD